MQKALFATLVFNILTHFSTDFLLPLELCSYCINTCLIYYFTDQVSSPSVFPLVPCTKSGDEITVGCLAYNFFPDSLTFQWTPDSSVSSVQYPSILNGNKYTAVSLVQVPKSEWISGVSFDCTVNHTGSVSPLISVSITGRVTPPTAISTSLPKVGRQPEVTVHVPPVEVINEGSGEVTMVCLVSSPVQQNYNISWLEYTGRRTENYKRGADSSPVKTRRGYSVSSIYSTTKEKWQTYTFECNVRSKGSNRILQRRAVSSAQLNAIECDRWMSGCCAIVSTSWQLCDVIVVCDHAKERAGVCLSSQDVSMCLCHYV